MLRLLFGNKVATVIQLSIVLLAVWKYNNGDVTGVADGIVTIIDNITDTLVKIWDAIFSSK